MHLSTLVLSAVALAATSVSAAPAPPGQIPYTYFSLPLQDQLQKNTNQVRGTPYERFFDPEIYVYPEMVAPGRRAIDCNTQAMRPDLSDVNTLIAPASTQLPFENAWCAYGDGQGYVSSRTHWPGVTKDMVSWWFWWHSAESVRYTLWHPWAHVSVKSSAVGTFNDPKLNNTQKLIGSVHSLTEIIGEPQQSIDIHWKRPSYFGLDESRFAPAGIVAAACGEIFIPNGSPLKAVDMIHLWYQTSNGLELRSRYYLANRVRVDVPVLGQLLPIDAIANLLGIKNFIVGRQLSSLQFAHDQQEMTHLAAKLPALYAAFGNGAK